VCISTPIDVTASDLIALEYTRFLLCSRQAEAGAGADTSNGKDQYSDADAHDCEIRWHAGKDLADMGFGPTSWDRTNHKASHL
jgi:hypothetical protein